jgi:hypothetical protein
MRPIISWTCLYSQLRPFYSLLLSISNWPHYHINAVFLFYLILHLIACGIGYVVSCLFDNEENATTLAPSIILPYVALEACFLMRAPSVLDHLVQILSHIRYWYEALIRNEFDSRNHNKTLILQSLTSNYKLTILDAIANRKQFFSNASSFNISQWEIVHIPR